jgi:hypothetical protein
MVIKKKGEVLGIRGDGQEGLFPFLPTLVLLTLLPFRAVCSCRHWKEDVMVERKMSDGWHTKGEVRHTSEKWHRMKGNEKFSSYGNAGEDEEGTTLLAMLSPW